MACTLTALTARCKPASTIVLLSTLQYLKSTILYMDGFQNVVSACCHTTQISMMLMLQGDTPGDVAVCGDDVALAQALNVIDDDAP